MSARLGANRLFKRGQQTCSIIGKDLHAHTQGFSQRCDISTIIRFETKTPGQTVGAAGRCFSGPCGSASRYWIRYGQKRAHDRDSPSEVI